MAAAVLLAVGAVFVVGQNQRLEAAFAAQLALDHDRCFTHLDGVVPEFDQRQAELSLASNHGLHVTMPAESSDFDLIDVRLCFGEPAVPGCEPEDVNGDGSVNVLDLIDVLLAFGTACP